MRKSRDNRVIYQVFPRNHTAAGNFKGLEEDLDRIAALGVDILYLMPVQPIGRVGRKGSLGSPYAIQDYRKINPEYGTWNDLKHLVQAAHTRGLKVIVDQVFNHTSRDSVLVQSHPEYMWHNAQGEMGNKAGDWSDVFDLDHTQNGLEEYLIDVLDTFLDLGIDGFRFDVATLIPASFFARFTKQAQAKYPDRDLYLLAEAIDSPFALDTRGHGYNADSNADLARAGFDLIYNYASFPWFRAYMQTHSLEDIAGYRAALVVEQASLPQQGTSIVRTLENHDQERLAALSRNAAQHRNLVAFSFFTKGPAFIYAGEEYGATHRPSLFDMDKVDWSAPDRDRIHPFIERMIALKKRADNTRILETCFLPTHGHLIGAQNFYPDHTEIGLFNLSDRPQLFPYEVIPDGRYRDLITGTEVEVDHNRPQDLIEPLYLRKL